MHKNGETEMSVLTKSISEDRKGKSDCHSFFRDADFSRKVSFMAIVFLTR
jgi:hypothetical protein